MNRIFYGPPGQKAKIPRKDKPSGPWGTRADGGYNTPNREPLDYPPYVALRRSTDMGQIYSELIRISSERESRYKDYEDMILDATIAAAIELMVDDSCQYERERGATVWVTSDDDRIVKAGEELWDIIQLEENLFDWVFSMANYGDFFLKVEGQEGRGVLQVQDDWHPADVQRIDINGALMGFRTPRNFVETTQAGSPLDSSREGDEFWDPWEFVHFRIQASQRRRREIERMRMAPMLRFEKRQYRVTTKYGVSVVEAARRLYKQQAMVEQSMIIARMTRAILKYIYKIQCGTDAEAKTAADTVLRIKDLLSQQTGLRIGESFEQQYSPPSGSEDIFLPIMGEKGDVTIETLGGEQNVSGIVDVKYLNTKMHGALKVPPAFLGNTEDLPGSLGESALLRLDIRYARTVKRIQRALVQGLTRLLQVHLAYKKLPIDPKRFAVEVDIVSTAEEEERKASMMSALGVAGELTRLNTDMRLQVPAREFARLIYSEVLQLPESFIEMLEKSTEIPPEITGAEGGAGGVGGMGMPGGDVMPPGDMPEPDEQEGAGSELELPPEGVGDEPETKPGAELGVPPGPGESTVKPGPRKKKLKETVDSMGGLIAKEAKRQAMGALTRAVRSSKDLRAALPISIEEGSDGTQTEHHSTSIREDKQVGESEEDKEIRGEIGQVIRRAVEHERTIRDTERERKKRAVEDLEEGRRVRVVR
jgi:hypothetical protein